MSADRPDPLRAGDRLAVWRAPHPASGPGEEPVRASPEPGSRGWEIFLIVGEDGGVTAYSGHVDLGTGIRTALAQIVADELDVAFDRVTMVLGDSRAGPDQGGTIASETIQVTAVPLRKAAAQARHHLVALAAEALGVRTEALDVEDGVVSPREGRNVHVAYGDLVRGRSIDLPLAADGPVKSPDAYRLVGRPVARTDIPLKAVGRWTYVHDVRVPGMLHGRVVRPPYAGLDAGDFVGNSLISVDHASVADVPGLVAVVVIRDFVGVVAEREEHAAAAARQLKITWAPSPGLPDLNAPETAVRANPSEPRRLLDRGDVEGALGSAAVPMNRTYVWPYQMHASIGPSCSVADWREDGLTVWSGTQNPQMLRADLARLTDLPEARITIVRLEAAGCYGRNCADDVGADAALLSRAVGRPVRVQLTREQEHAWEPKGAAQVMDVRGGLAADGSPAAYDFETRYPSNFAPTLALLLTGTIPAVPGVIAMGDRTSVPPYDYANARVTVHDMAPIVRSAWLRGVSALPNSFAHECFIDELASEAGTDAIEYRLRYLPDRRGAELIRAVADRAEWVPHTRHGTHGGEGDVLRGRGFAYAVYVHGTFPGMAAAWSAWVADVAVNTVTGDVAVSRVVVGQDTGLMINPAGVRHQIHGNVIQSTSRVLTEQVTFDARAVTSRDWGSYPIIAFPDVPAIDVVMMPRPLEPPLGAGESASVPSAAAIANAIFDATGVRMRELPFTPERVRAALNPNAAPPPAPRRRGRLAAWLGGAATAALATAATLMPWRPAIPAVPRPEPGVFSAATLERGRLVAAVGGCGTCHDGPAGRLAGGRGLETPFGIVYATNITPDPTAGIGAWSYPAFERAMREGISRDGHHLYPAHPYAAYALVSDADLQALYAHLMTQPEAASSAPETALPFPFGIRALMAGWNALFLRHGTFAPDPARSEAWNRGAYLVEGLGHCGACHTPRNLLGAERGGAAQLAGALADGWEAPALTALSRAPIPWSEDELFTYLSTGTSRHHGHAAGPMGEVVANLSALPARDIRAIATYLASLAEPATPDADDREALAAELDATSRAVSLSATPAARLYDGACAMCHAGADLFGAGPSLALNTNLNADRPDNLIQVILNGVAVSGPERVPMPAFRDTLNDAQIADLVADLRARFAPTRAPWSGVPELVARIRARPAHGLTVRVSADP